nr:MAG TPA: hypothetical protein [Caudoviricetes sp.]
MSIRESSQSRLVPQPAPRACFQQKKCRPERRHHSLSEVKIESLHRRESYRS